MNAPEVVSDPPLLVADPLAGSAHAAPPTVECELPSRRRRRPLPLRRYLATLFLGTIAPLVVLAAVLIYSGASSQRDTVQKSMVDLARTLSASVDSEIGRTMLALQVLAMSPALDTGDLAEFRRQAEVTRALNGRWSNVGLVRIDGARLVNLRVPAGQPIPVGNDDSFLEAARQGKTLVSDAKVSPTSNKLLVYVSVPVMRDGKPRYAIAATMEADTWTSWLKSQAPEGAVAAIDDRAGVIFARSERPEAFVGRTGAEELRAAYRGDASGVQRVADADGVSFYAAYQASSTTGWHSLILMPAEAVDARLHKYVVALAGAALAVLLLALLAAMIVAQPLRSATAQVKDAIVSLGRGERPGPRELPIAELDDTHRAAELAAELLRSARRAVRNRTAQFEALLASAPIGACLVDGHGRLAAINPAAEALFEDRPLESGEDFRELVREHWTANADRLLAHYDRTLATGEHAFIPELRDDVRGRVFEWHMERLPLPDGGSGVVCYVRDVTMHVEAREALSRSREELQTVYETAPVGMCVLDRELRFVRINEELAALNGCPVEDHIGRSVREILPAVADSVEPVLRRIIDSGKAVLEHEIVGETPAAPGVQRVWLESWHPIKDSAGRVTGINVATREVTEQRRIARELAQRREELEAMVASLRAAQWQLQSADRQKDEFLAMLAHELRNPLTPIGNACELLARMYPDHADALTMVGMIRRQVAQLTRLVDDLLDVSRITQRRIELKRDTVDLADVVAHAVETVEPLVREKGHALSIVSSYRHLHVNGDAARLAQCVVNVLNNAAKYTDRGGRLRIETAEEDGEAVIRVTDNGEGITAELLPHIFDLFVQGDRTLDRAQGGLGIGLSVVRQLIEQHGGRVTARSDGPGTGSTFEIRLPLAEPPASLRAARARSAGAPKRVLVVDDNVDAADSLAMVLQSEGHTVETVYSGVDALARILPFAPGVVLLDIGLPQLDGYEVARRIRALPDGPHIRVVALTGYGQAEDLERSRAAGFDAHIVKPVDLHEVLDAIEGLASAATI